MKNLNLFSNIINDTKRKSPLIHAITNPISINDCANITLAAGARPIMAEHPDEVEEITQKSDALAINLGNITDIRMKSMKISCRTAATNKIPVVLDPVGAAASKLRSDFANNLIDKFSFSIIKGNMSEIKSLLGLSSHPLGIDVGKEDEIDSENIKTSVTIAKKMSAKSGSVIMITGKYDIVSDNKNTFIIKNGTPMLTKITGTGCMSGILAASYLPNTDPLTAAAFACICMGIAGELADKNSNGPSSFRTAFLDAIYLMDCSKIAKYADFNIL